MQLILFSHFPKISDDYFKLDIIVSSDPVNLIFKIWFQNRKVVWIKTEQNQMATSFIPKQNEMIISLCLNSIHSDLININKNVQNLLLLSCPINTWIFLFFKPLSTVCVCV